MASNDTALKVSSFYYQ